MMHALSGLDQQILNRLATEAATVFERVEMIETFEERKLFNQELSLARETQQTLLPQAVPELEPFRLSAFSEPTHHVGGDFYDFLDVGTDHLAGVLADVSGKGVSAALLSSLVQGSLQMEVRSGTDFGEALTRINRFLMDRLQANRFVTLFIFKIQANGQGQFVSAGHNPAYLFRSKTGSIEELKSEHMILGAFNFAEYSSQNFNLETKDILVIYTDGLTEAEDPQGDMFGEERLKDLIIEQAPLGGEHLRRTILSNIKDFTQGRAQTDDITFMLVEHGG
jgi:serine phosphatase RsbU (regulator of sigma subunit)